MGGVDGNLTAGVGSTDSGSEPILEDGLPCITHGVCRLCHSNVGSGQWGNARCRGCAVVDIQSFRQHLFRPLLLDWHPKLRPTAPIAERHFKVARVDMTPPPLGRGGALRLKDLEMTCQMTRSL